MFYATVGVDSGSMLRCALQSDSLAGVVYRRDQSWLEVEFRDGTRYRYFDVPLDCLQQLLAADSKGSYFNRNIRNRFRFQRIAGDDRPLSGEN